MASVDPSIVTEKPILSLGGLELRLDHPLTTDSTDYLLEGRLCGGGAELYCEGGSLQIQNGHSGLVDEVFLASDGRFALQLTPQPDNDTKFAIALCDGLGTVVATAPLTLRHRGLTAGDPTLATLSRDFAIEVLTRAGQRRKQILAPAGVRLPGKFSCVGRSTDQSGRIVVPLWDGNRLVQEIVVGEIDPRLPIGTVVDIELQMAVDLAATVRVLVRQAGRGEIVQIPAPPPPPCKPTPTQIADTLGRIEALLPEFGGQYGAELEQNFTSHRNALQAAVDAGDADRAATHFSELLEQREHMEIARLQVGFPPLQKLTQMVKHCLFEAANLADRTGRDREPLFAQVYALEQAAEQAHAEKNAGRYREACDRLQTLAGAFAEGTAAARAPTAHDVGDALKGLQAHLATVLAIAELKGRSDHATRLQQVAGQHESWTQRGKQEPAAVLREVREALAEIAHLEQILTAGRNRTSTHVEGMLEGSGGA